MERKYRIIEDDSIINEGYPEVELFRIVATRSFGIVAAGMLGGYIEDESNLSHEGDCWIWHDAQVFLGATVCDNAQISDNAEVSHGSKVGGKARVEDNAKVRDKSQIFDRSRILDNALVINSTIQGRSKIKNGAYVTNSVIDGDLTISNESRIQYSTILGDSRISNTTVKNSNILNAELYGTFLVNKCSIHDDIVINAQAVTFYEASIINNSDFIIFHKWWDDGINIVWTRSNDQWYIGNSFRGKADSFIRHGYRESDFTGNEFKKFVDYVNSRGLSNGEAECDFLCD